MCRLLGYVASKPLTLRQVVGSDLDPFVDLARARHGDGWGFAWPGTDGTVEVRKEPANASGSDDFAELAENVTADCMMVHLRWATLDLSVRAANTHPFTGGGMAFAHNGSVPAIGALDAMVSPDVAPARQGDTDSELIFLAVRSALAADPTLTARAALAQVVTGIADNLPFSSLNCMLVTSTHLHVACRYDPSAIRVGDSADYYALRYSVGADAVVVGSSGWPQEGWADLGDGEMLSISRHTLETEVSKLRPGGGATTGAG